MSGHLVFHKLFLSRSIVNKKKMADVTKGHLSRYFEYIAPRLTALQAHTSSDRQKKQNGNRQWQCIISPRAIRCPRQSIRRPRISSA